MKLPIFLISFLIAFSPIAFTQVYVEGYYRKDGTYVRPHYRSNPDGVKWNNYGPSQSDAELLQYGKRDFDGDGISNQFDFDDDNDGTNDEFDKYQYDPCNNLYYNCSE